MKDGPVDRPGVVPPLEFEGDLLHLRVTGEIGVAQMQTIIDMGEQLFARHGYILFLGDARNAGGVHPDARKLQAARLKQFMRPSHTAIYHVNTVTRVMSTLAQRGIELLLGKTYPISFHRDEAEARAMLAEQRALLRRSG